MTIPKFEPIAFVQSDPDGHLHLAEITKTEACQNIDQWDKQVGWKAVPLHTEDQLSEAYEAGKRDAIPEPMTLPPMYPDESKESQFGLMKYAQGWNACRAAMLAAAPKGEE